METFAFNLKYAKWYSSDSKWESEMEDAKADANEIVEKLKNYLKIEILQLTMFPFSLII